MYKRHLPDGGGWNEKFIDGVEEFLRFGKLQVEFMDEEKIMCPCSKCRNGKFQDEETVRLHLYRKVLLTTIIAGLHKENRPLIQPPKFRMHLARAQMI